MHQRSLKNDEKKATKAAGNAPSIMIILTVLIFSGTKDKEYVFHIHLDKAAKARRLCTRLMRSSRRAGGGRNRRRMFVICAWIFPRCRISMAAPGGRGQGERHTAELGQCNIAYNWRYYFCAFKKFTVLGGRSITHRVPSNPPTSTPKGFP